MIQKIIQPFLVLVVTLFFLLVSSGTSLASASCYSTSGPFSKSPANVAFIGSNKDLSGHAINTVSNNFTWEYFVILPGKNLCITHEFSDTVKVTAINQSTKTITYSAVCDKPGGGTVVQGNSYTQSVTGGTKTFTCQSDWTFLESLSCNSTHHKNASNTACVSNTKICTYGTDASYPNHAATAQKTWNSASNSWGSCVATACETSRGFKLVNGACKGDYTLANDSYTDTNKQIVITSSPVILDVMDNDDQKQYPTNWTAGGNWAWKIGQISNLNSCFTAEKEGDDEIKISRFGTGAKCKVGTNYTLKYSIVEPSYVAWCDGNAISSNSGSTILQEQGCGFYPYTAERDVLFSGETLNRPASTHEHGKMCKASVKNFTNCNDATDELAPGFATVTIKFKCPSGQHNDGNGACVSNTQQCTPANAITNSGTQTWSGSAWGSCTGFTCGANYNPLTNSCQLKCAAGKYRNGGSCVDVETGKYSLINNGYKKSMPRQRGYRHFKRGWMLAYRYDRASFYDSEGFYNGYFNRHGYYFEDTFYRYDRFYSFKDRVRGRGLFDNNYYMPSACRKYGFCNKRERTTMGTHPIIEHVNAYINTYELISIGCCTLTTPIELINMKLKFINLFGLLVL
ncbi:MAG: Unknown protein [uncultured Sulfurovum sp.]|uniref:Uncharacterized protein n=1 Tax=uncultured Sulfurovum sp. TaxID=269237 RepID=A0A6S6U113_9BACT|nr:MAG: Unknown protein [uncultured Sulfurovum sp.]